MKEAPAAPARARSPFLLRRLTPTRVSQEGSGPHEMLEIGARAACLRSGQPHACDIIERRSTAGAGEGGEGGAAEYYVHYVGLNRRLDEWVAADRIVHDTSGAGVRDGAELGGRRATRKMKRRIDDMNALQARGSRPLMHNSARPLRALSGSSSPHTRRALTRSARLQAGASHDEALEKEHEARPPCVDAAATRSLG